MPLTLDRERRARPNIDRPGHACPACRSRLDVDGHHRHCPGCGCSFPATAGIPDLRLSNDRYLGLADEKAKAARLARLEGTTDVIGLAGCYYAMTADVSASRREAFLAHLKGAERRGEALCGLLPRSGRIIEVGCGSGGLLAAAAARGMDVEGCDVGSRWLVVARRRLADRGVSAPLTAARAEQLPWPDASFDAAVADSLIEHADDPAAALREMARVLRPGGNLLLWSPNRYSIGVDPHVQLRGVGWLPRTIAGRYVRLRRGPIWLPRCISAASAARLAARAGFRSIRVEPPGVPPDWGRSPGQTTAIRIYEAARGIPVLRDAVLKVGPLWQLRATR